MIATPPVAAIAERRSGRLHEPVASRTGREGPHRIADEGDDDAHQAEQQDLCADVTAIAVDELRQDRGEEHDHLRIGRSDHEPFTHDPQDRLGFDAGRERVGQRSSMAHRLHPEIDEVGRADELDRGEHDDRPRHDCADSGGDCRNLHDNAQFVADHGRQAGSPPERDPSADHEEHARPRNHDHHEGGSGERRAALCKSTMR